MEPLLVISFGEPEMLIAQVLGYNGSAGTRELDCSGFHADLLGGVGPNRE